MALRGLAPPADGGRAGSGMTYRPGSLACLSSSPGLRMNPGWDVHSRQRPVTPLVLTGAFHPADALQLMQCCRQGIGCVGHLVLIKPGAQLLIVLELVAPALDRCHRPTSTTPPARYLSSDGGGPGTTPFYAVEHFTPAIGVGITGKQVGSAELESRKLGWDAEYVIADPFVPRKMQAHVGDLTVTFAGLKPDDERRPTYEGMGL